MPDVAVDTGALGGNPDFDYVYGVKSSAIILPGAGGSHPRCG